MTDPKPKRRWYHLTPGRFALGLLAVEVILLLSDYFRWFPFNDRKGWTVLIGVAVLGTAILDLLIWFGSCLILRRGFRFSLRSLLLFVVVCAVVCSWFAVRMHQARQQREAVEAIEDAGGMVAYAKAGPAWLITLLGDDFCREVDEVVLWGQHRDADLVHLKWLPALRTVHLAGRAFTDRSVEHLKGLSQLEHISITTPSVTVSAAEELQKALPNCRIHHQPPTRMRSIGPSDAQ